MSWLAPRLNRRVQIGFPVQTENSDGGFDFSFTILTTVWMSIRPISFRISGASYIRGQQVTETATHLFEVRKQSVVNLGPEFSMAFSTAWKMMENISSIKANYYLFLESTSTTKGRLFKITSALDEGENREFITITAEEIEERGAGWPI